VLGIQVLVRFHAELARFAPDAGRQARLSLAAGATVGELVAAYPALGQRRIVVGLNGELASPETVLHDGDRVDLLTPMSGGFQASE
jgi:molybdopterin converting factor small subunit